jgi:hypothetical protein
VVVRDRLIDHCLVDHDLVDMESCNARRDARASQ